MSTTIKMKSVSKIYDLHTGHPVTAIDNITLSIPAGYVFGFLGSSGAGKTTLIKLLGGLIKPTCGDIYLNGQPLVPDTGQVGVSIEETSTIDGTLSVWDNLISAFSKEDSSKNIAKEYIEDLLLRSDLWKDRDKLVVKLSYSKQRTVAILHAVINDPPLLLFDEPLSGLDPRIIRSTKIWLPKQAHELGKTIVIATREPNIAQELCDYVAILHRGQLVASQSTHELLQSTQQEPYQIRVKGYLDHRWATWFDGLNITRTENGESIISGPIFDQSALHGVLNRIHNLALPLVSVDRTKPSLTAVYQMLIREVAKRDALS